MSEDNVEVVRRAWDGWIRDRWQGLVPYLEPDVVWETSHFHDWPESAYRGPKGVERFLTEWRGKITHVDNYEDPAEALEAAGLWA